MLRIITKISAMLVDRRANISDIDDQSIRVWNLSEWIERNFLNAWRNKVESKTKIQKFFCSSWNFFNLVGFHSDIDEKRRLIDRNSPFQVQIEMVEENLRINEYQNLRIDFVEEKRRLKSKELKSKSKQMWEKPMANKWEEMLHWLKDKKNNEIEERN